MQEQVCKNCGNNFTGKFCNSCGEKVYSENSKSFAHVAEEVFHFLTHLDSKFLKTLKEVFTRPGRLSLEYCDGIRKKYFKPVSLFLIGIIIYLLLPISQGLNMDLRSNMLNTNAIGLRFFENMVNHKMEEKNISFEVLSEKYSQKSVVIAKPMLFIILPLLGLALMAFFYKRKIYYFDHFILAVETSNFFLYLAFIFLPILLSGIAGLAGLLSGKDYYYNDYVTGPIVVTALILSWSVAFKRFYRVGTAEAILKSVFFLAPFALVVFFIYRFLLFLATLLFI